nr:hypothetical protein [Nocardia yunnanensis]
MSASLRAGLVGVVGLPQLGDPGTKSAASLAGTTRFAAVMPVDTPDVGPAAVKRVVAAAQDSSAGLARAVFEKRGETVALGIPLLAFRKSGGADRFHRIRDGSMARSGGSAR